MHATLRKIAGVVFRPEEEWIRIARDAEGPLVLLFRVIVPLALVPPLAFACQSVSSRGVAADAALAAATTGLVTEIAGLALVATVICLIAPLYEAPRDFGAAFRVVAYAAVPVWISGIVLAAPLRDFPLLTIIVLIGLMHALYLFYLGLHHVAKVSRRNAAECAGAVVLASLMLSTVVGYYGSAAGLFPKIG